jgi:hypothetical protein
MFPLLRLLKLKMRELPVGWANALQKWLLPDLYNEREGRTISSIYGAVTTGHAWKFLKLRDQTVYIDIEDYYINHPKRILGILTYMIKTFDDELD